MQEQTLYYVLHIASYIEYGIKSYTCIILVLVIKLLNINLLCRGNEHVTNTTIPIETKSL